MRVLEGVKRIKFVQDKKVYEGDFISKGKFGKMAGMGQGKIYYKVKVQHNDIEFSVFRVSNDEILEVFY